jgi:RNA polymerase sigma-70 factor (ECF subfamily)
VDLPDEELLAAARKQPEAFAAFYRRHERALLAYFMRRAGDPEVAADLAAETFATVLAQLRRFDPARGSALAWLFGIARHKLLRAAERGRVEDRARRRLGMPALVLDDEALERIERLGAEDRVAALLERLPAKQAQAVQAHVLEDQPYERVASGLQCSESVVRQRVSRGLAKLRSIVEESP